MQATWSKYGTLSQQDFRPLDVGGENGYLAPDPSIRVGYGSAGAPAARERRKKFPHGLGAERRSVIAYPSTLGETRGRRRCRSRPPIPIALHGHQNVFRSRNGGDSWQIVSPDLSRPNEGTPSNLDAATLADTNNVQRHGVVYAIAPSPILANVVWAGTDDGYIWLSRPSTGSGQALAWRNVTRRS